MNARSTSSKDDSRTRHARVMHAVFYFSFVFIFCVCFLVCLFLLESFKGQVAGFLISSCLAFIYCKSVLLNSLTELKCAVPN